MNEAYDVVSYYDIAHWGQDFLDEVADSARKNELFSVTASQLAVNTSM